MAVVHIPAPFLDLTGGRSPVAAEGATVRRVIDSLEREWPGIRARLLEEGRLRGNIRVVVDGRISPLGLLEKTSSSSEVHFVTAVSGG